jgi:hypothetical protein
LSHQNTWPPCQQDGEEVTGTAVCVGGGGAWSRKRAQLLCVLYLRCAVGALKGGALFTYYDQ